MDVSLAIIGAGQRGTIYARIARDLGARIGAVAEPQEGVRTRFATEFGLDDAAVFTDWRDLLARPRLADAVAICTQDRDHADPAVAAAGVGYHILLEKPMATNEADAQRIVAAVQDAGVVFGVCHVLRYTEYTRALVDLLRADAIGRIVSVEHLEPIGWWHFAHSFVRGNWRCEAETSPMLIQKNIHDIDWLGYVVGEPVARVSSFGTLLEFRPVNAPAGAAARCLDCAVRATCPFDAVRIYHGFLSDPEYSDWPLTVLTPNPTPTSIDDALRNGPYGECVYAGHNDVVDHQVVSLEYASGVTASFTTVAFTEMAGRKTRIFGARGWIEGDGSVLRVHDFTTDDVRTIDTAVNATPAGGHGGGDEGLMRAFLAAVEAGDPSLVTSDAAASLASLEVVWAAERARHAGTVEVPA